MTTWIDMETSVSVFVLKIVHIYVYIPAIVCVLTPYLYTLILCIHRLVIIYVYALTFCRYIDFCV